MGTNNSEHYDSFQGEQYFLTVVETGIPFYYTIPEKHSFVARFQRVWNFLKVKLRARPCHLQFGSRIVTVVDIATSDSHALGSCQLNCISGFSD